MTNILQLIIGYALLVLPQIYDALVQYQAQHPNPYIAILISLIGGIVLHKAQPR